MDGIMKDYKKEDLVAFINILISHGLISQEEGTYPILKLNNYSMEILKGDKKVIIREVKKAKSKYEINDVCISLPTIVSNNGIENILEIDLNSDELSQLSNSL